MSLEGTVVKDLEESSMWQIKLKLGNSDKKITGIPQR